MKIYTTPSTLIEYEAPSRLLRATWLEECFQLKEEAVKEEIMNVLRFVQEFKIKKIIVDSRHYPFRENFNIQHWINCTFMPMIMECGVEKYAIIIKEPVPTKMESLYDSEADDLQVEYFTTQADALQWVNA